LLVAASDSAMVQIGQGHLQGRLSSAARELAPVRTKAGLSRALLARSRRRR
jgi:hypothetical protein